VHARSPMRALVIDTLAIVALQLGCHVSNASDGSDGASTSHTSGSDTTDGSPTTGMFQCADSARCTFVLASQTLDDRIDVFLARSSDGDMQIPYRGSVDVDLKPNPMGDNSGELLDEPYGLAVANGALYVMLGHYPTRTAGSLLSFPLSMFASALPGTTLGKDTYFASGEFIAPVSGVALGELEPIFVLAHPSGRLLVAVLNNDLLLSEDQWTNPGKLLVVDPHTPDIVGTFELTGLDNVGCTAAWGIVALDEHIHSIALACDGGDDIAVLDVSGVGEGTPSAAAASLTGCIADLPFPDKRVRFFAPDGSGGVLAVEAPGVPLGTENTRLWWFDGGCEQVDFGEIGADVLADVRTVVHVRGDATTPSRHWLLASDGPPAIQVVVAGNDAAPALCGKLEGLDVYWTGDDGEPIAPYALALTSARDGLAIGAGPREAIADAPGYGRVLFGDVMESSDPCGESSDVLVRVVDLTDAAGSVEANDPGTWRRAPNVLAIHEP